MATPTLTEINPYDIKWQGELINLVRRDFDYSNGSLEVLLSGAVGSAKSLAMAHLIITHCLFNNKAEVLVGRLAMPHLRQTLLQMILDHLGDDVGYIVNRSTGVITFENASRIIPISWQDGKFKKVRSYAPTMIAIEELTENKTKEAYTELKMRLGRRPDVKESLFIMATNPDSPSHWAYQEIIEKQNDSRKVFYSVTAQNPFLPKSYVENLKENLSHKEYLRMVEGQWLDLVTEVVYSAYSKDLNYKNEAYRFNYSMPVDLMFDFNIGLGKPMSAAIGQYINGHFHIAKDFIVHGARTGDIVEDICSSGLLDNAPRIRVFGDASGKSRDTRGVKSDYDIIEKVISNFYPVKPVEMCIPSANPAVRSRHNLSNALFCNANKRSSVTIYRDASTADQGFRLTKLKKGSNYIEDDSDEFQHVTTAITYYFYQVKEKLEKTFKSRIRIK